MVGNRQRRQTLTVRLIMGNGRRRRGEATNRLKRIPLNTKWAGRLAMPEEIVMKRRGLAMCYPAENGKIEGK